MELVASFIVIACNNDENLAPNKDKYVYDIPQTDLSDDVFTGAYYTNITSEATWRKNGVKIYAGTPLLGEYFSSSENVLKQQIEWAIKLLLISLFLLGMPVLPIML